MPDCVSKLTKQYEILAISLRSAWRRNPYNEMYELSSEGNDSLVLAKETRPTLMKVLDQHYIETSIVVDAVDEPLAVGRKVQAGV